MLIPVIVFWLAVLAYVPYHFRKCAPVHEFLCGFAALWMSILRATDVVSSHELHVSNGDGAFDSGVLVGIITLIILILFALASAGYTIYLAS